MYKHKNSYYTDNFGIKGMLAMSIEKECDTIFKSPQKYGMVRLCIKKESDNLFSTFIPGGMEECGTNNINHCMMKYNILPRNKPNHANVKIFYDKDFNILHIEKWGEFVDFHLFSERN